MDHLGEISPDVALHSMKPRIPSMAIHESDSAFPADPMTPEEIQHRIIVQAETQEVTVSLWTLKPVWNIGFLQAAKLLSSITRIVNRLTEIEWQLILKQKAGSE